MKTLTYNTYSFSELNESAQRRAMDKARDFLGETWGSECVQEDAKQCLALLGFDIDKIYFTGFWSQGDGACFNGTFSAGKVNAAGLKEHAPQDETLHALADSLTKFSAEFPNAAFRIKHSGSYCHEYCTEFSGDLNPENTDMEIADYAEREKEFVDLARSAMRWIYRQLEADYNWQTAEEQVREYLATNEYDFDENGDISS